MMPTGWSIGFILIALSFAFISDSLAALAQACQRSDLWVRSGRLIKVGLLSGGLAASLGYCIFMVANGDDDSVGNLFGLIGFIVFLGFYSAILVPAILFLRDALGCIARLRELLAGGQADEGKTGDLGDSEPTW